MKRLLSILLIGGLFSGSALAAKTVKDYYRMQLREQSQLYFILPYNLPSVSKKIPDALMDVTCFTDQDTVTVNLTITSPTALQTDSICLETGGKTYCVSRFETFFIEQSKKGWQHRYSCRVPYDYLTSCFVSPRPFTLHIYSATSSLTYRLGDSTWKKHPELGEIMHLIESNRHVLQK